MKTWLTFLILSLALVVVSCNRLPDYGQFPKIDAHVHADTYDFGFIHLAQKNNFGLMTLVTQSSSQEQIDQELAWVGHLHRNFPEVINYSTTICMENFASPQWTSETIERLKRDFEDGAIAVKIWKDIGMTFRRSDDSFIMIDDEEFDPIFNFIASNKIPVVGHLGEPKNCWLPLDSMTVNSDRNYFSEHPEYHMYLHPDYPSYEEQIQARDHMLEKHPDLVFIGAHLGSLEWNVDELAKRLDQYPNMAVDMAARICHFQVQDRDKVRRFIIDYKDRLLYGTDVGVSENSSPERLEWIQGVWEHDWRYFTSDDIMTSDKVTGEFQGLKLPLPVLKNIYYENAKEWLNI